MKDLVKKVAVQHLKKTAGEVHFIKDKSDSNQWAYSNNNPSARQINNDFEFNGKMFAINEC